MSQERKATFAAAYAQAFRDSYPQFDVSKTATLIEKAVAAACANIRGIAINGAAFKLTAKRLGIKHTYKAFDAYLSGAAEGWQA